MNRIVAVPLLAVLFSSFTPALAGDAWVDLGQGLAGTHGSPALAGEGPLVAGTTASLTLTDVRAQTAAWLVLGVTAIDAPLMGGVLVPEPNSILVLPTGGTAGSPSSVVVEGAVPTGIPAGTEIYIQYWIDDPAGIFGFAASNAVLGTTEQLHDIIANPFDFLLFSHQPASASKAIYASQDFGTQTFVRSADCWAADIDLTGISPWNQAYGAQRAGTLVSPRHIVFAQHYPLSTTPGNNDIVFVTADDVTVTRQIVAVSYPAVDIGVGLLDSDVPPEIGFFKVLPPDWGDYLWQTTNLPMLHLDQEEKALVRDMLTLGPSSTYVSHKSPVAPLRFQFTEGLIGGDSGNPAFIVIGGEAVLMLTHHFATSGPFYTAWLDEVNAAMTTLGGGYQLTAFDLLGFLQP